MINTGVFDYIRVLDKAADASWKRNEAITNNIANATTPGYKRQDVSFEAELRRALGNCRYQTLDQRVSALRTSRLEGRPYTDYAGYSYRLDENNVDIDNENAYLAENQIKYQGLIAGIKQEFQNLRAVLK